MLKTNAFRSFPAHAVRRVATILILSAALQACGGGGGSDTGQVTEPPPSGNRAPTITGSPGTQATVGQAYTFTPQASDPDGNSLTFTVENLPGWATFDGTTGRITGTPTAEGQFANVTITVSDGTDRASLAPYSIAVAAAGSGGGTGTAALRWTPPTERSDGSSLTNLAGYRIRYGTSAGSFSNTITVDNPGLTSYVVESLDTGTYFFVITAFDANGVESDSSNTASKTIG